MNKLLVLLIILAGIQACRNSPKSASSITTPTDSTNTSPISVFPPLEAGTFEVSDKDFGEIIELHGESLPIDTIFAPSETQMLIKDGYFIASTRKSDKFFYIFRLSDMKVVAHLGTHGRGPMEFTYPYLIRSQTPDKLCYIYDIAKEQLFYIDQQFNLKSSVPLPKSGEKNLGADKQIEIISDKEMIFTSAAPKGKAIYSYHMDSTAFHEIYNLAFDKRFKLSYAYTGDFAVNYEKKRMVYAYKYFKALKFISLDSLQERLIKFDYKEPEGKTAADILAPTSVTHYWGISAGKDRVYVLYSGRTPLVVSRELDKGQGYIFVEEYDWNGNLKRKFRLDQWGYFHVDDNTNTIYMTADQEQPFYTFRLPG